MVLCPLAYDLEQLERLASEIVVPFRGTRRAGA
jgi:hypothetical protein